MAASVSQAPGKPGGVKDVIVCMSLSSCSCFPDLIAFSQLNALITENLLPRLCLLNSTGGVGIPASVEGTETVTPHS